MNSTMPMRNSDFCAFILTHGRPDKVYTYDALVNVGRYSGKVFIVIDDEDPTQAEYRARFGDAVLIFSKSEIARTFDEGDNFNDRRAIVYARNACFDLARKIGVTYFIQLDDDYRDFRYKINASGEYINRRDIRNLDAVFDALLDYYKSIPALSIAIAQGGDFVGGDQSDLAENLAPLRKCMNTIVCSIDRPFSFFGRINEDVNVYTNLGRRGGLFLTIPSLAIDQKQTQGTEGGMTETYQSIGTYVKSFYSVMYSPSCVRIREMIGRKYRRIHHSVKWGHTVPAILDERYRKAA